MIKATEIDEPSVPSLDVLQAGLFYLLTRYAAQPSDTIAEAVVDQLSALCAHPQIILLPVQKRVFAKLLNEWRVRTPRSRPRACTLHQLH